MIVLSDNEALGLSLLIVQVSILIFEIVYRNIHNDNTDRGESTISAPLDVLSKVVKKVDE